MSNYINFEERTKEEQSPKTKRMEPVYKPFLLPKGTFPVLTDGRKGHTVMLIPGINYYPEVKGSPDAVQTKIDLENEVQEKKSTSSSTKK